MWHINHKAPHYAVFSNPATLFLLDPNIFLSTLYSDTVSLCSSLNVTDQVAHPYKTRKIRVLYIFTVLDSKLEDPRFCNEWQKSFPQSALNFLMTGILICYGCSQILELFHTVKGFFTSSCCDIILHAVLKTWSYLFPIATCILPSFLIQTLIFHCLSPVMTEERVEMWVELGSSQPALTHTTRILNFFMAEVQHSLTITEN